MFSRPLGSGFRHRELSRFLFRDFFFSSSRCGEGFSFQADTYRCSLDSPPPPSSTRTTEKGKSQRLELRQKALGFPHRPSPRQVGAASREAARGGRAGAFVQQSIRSRNSEKKKRLFPSLCYDFGFFPATGKCHLFPPLPGNGKSAGSVLLEEEKRFCRSQQRRGPAVGARPSLPRPGPCAGSASERCGRGAPRCGLLRVSRRAVGLREQPAGLVRGPESLRNLAF